MTEASGDTSSTDTGSRRGRTRWLVVSLWSAVVLALIGLAVALASVVSERNQLSEVLAEMEDALRESEDRADAASDELADMTDQLADTNEELAELQAMLAMANARITSLQKQIAENGWGHVEVAGIRLPSHASSASVDEAVGMVAPSVTGHDWEGATHSIAADGRPKVVVFLAHWCPHCQAEVPVVQAWLDAGNAPSDIDFYSVSTLTRPSIPTWPPQTWLQDEGWTTPVIMDDSEGSIAQAYGLTGVPYYVVLDGRNQVVGRVTGQLPSDGLDQLFALAREGTT